MKYFYLKFILLIFFITHPSFSHFDNKQHSIVHYYSKIDQSYKKSHDLICIKEKIKSSFCMKKNYNNKK